jgi:tyrosinase
VRERSEYSCLSTSERQHFHEAYLHITNPANTALYTQMKAAIQRHQTGFAAIHGPDQFLPWHRAYLLEIEDLLRQAPGYCDVTIPWWDVSAHPNNPFNYDPFGPNALGGNGHGSCVPDGPFAFWVPPTKTTCLTRDFQSVPVVPTWTQMQALLNISDYVAFSNNLQAKHNALHVDVGGDAATALSPNEPLFWLKHGWVDYIWGLAHLSPYPYPDVPMPYLTHTTKPSEMITLTSVRYVRSSTWNRCLLVHVPPMYWYNIDVLQASVFRAPILTHVYQAEPRVMTTQQQNLVLRFTPPKCRSDMKAMLQQEARDTRSLCQRLTNTTRVEDLEYGFDLASLVTTLHLEADCVAQAWQDCETDDSSEDYAPTPDAYSPTPGEYYGPTSRKLSPTPYAYYLPPTMAYHAFPTPLYGPHRG